MAYDFTELNKAVANWVTDDPSEITRYNFHEPKPNNITCNVGPTEMLRVAEDGFYVRGEKIPVDDKEAATVYNAFKEFLVWSRLHRD
jgi:hypothetical protein